MFLSPSACRYPFLFVLMWNVGTQILDNRKLWLVEVLTVLFQDIDMGHACSFTVSTFHDFEICISVRNLWLFKGFPYA